MADISRLKKRMSVIAADGRRIGFVSRMAWPNKIRLTSLNAGHAYDHLIPLNWIGEIGKYVFLNRASAYVAAHWENVASVPKRHAPGAAQEPAGDRQQAPQQKAA
jgi:hypothetical protein